MTMITLGGHTFHVKTPAVADCAALSEAAAVNSLFARCAALALCWPGKRGRNGKPSAVPKWDFLAYGRDVYNELSEAGHDHTAITIAGYQALGACIERVYPSAADDEGAEQGGEVVDAADFSEAPAEPTGGSSSPSVGSTANHPSGSTA